MIVVLPDRDGNGAHWRLINRTDNGADVVAMAPIGGTTDGGAAGSWQDAVEQLREGDGEVRIVATGDGHFQWILTTPPDGPVAQSPAIYRDADSCRRAFALARRVARTVVGAEQHRKDRHREPTR